MPCVVYYIQTQRDSEFLWRWTRSRSVCSMTTRDSERVKYVARTGTLMHWPISPISCKNIYFSVHHHHFFLLQTGPDKIKRHHLWAGLHRRAVGSFRFIWTITDGANIVATLLVYVCGELCNCISVRGQICKCVTDPANAYTVICKCVQDSANQLQWESS